MSTPNRIWLELDPPTSNSEGHDRAALLSSMLLRLGIDYGPSRHACWWNERKQRYCFTLDTAGTFVEAGDHGHWYNLDFLATTPETP